MTDYICKECGIKIDPHQLEQPCPACGSENIFLRDDAPAATWGPRSSGGIDNVSYSFKSLTGTDTMDYVCHDCREVFNSHDKDPTCPSCTSGYILNYTEIGEDESRFIEDLKKEKRETTLFFKFLILFASVPLLIVSIVNKMPNLFFYSFLFMIIGLLMGQPSLIPSKDRDTLDEKKPLPSFFIIISSLVKKLIKGLIRRLTFTTYELLVIRQRAVIWSSPAKKNTNMVSGVKQGEKIKAVGTITIGDEPWFTIHFKGYKRYILSEDVIYMNDLLKETKGHSLFIVGEKQEVHLFNSPSEESEIAQTLTRGTYIHDIGKVYGHDIKNAWEKLDFSHDSSAYWSLNLDETWIEVYKGPGLIGYARKDNFFNYYSWT